MFISHLLESTGNYKDKECRADHVCSVHKWRKVWTAPSGLQPESSYKVCKWVRVDDKVSPTETSSSHQCLVRLANTGMQDVDDETNGIDGEDDDEHEDHDEEDGNEDGADEADGEAKPTTTSTPGPVDTVPATPAAAAVAAQPAADAPAVVEETSLAPAESAKSASVEPVASIEVSEPVADTQPPGVADAAIEVEAQAEPTSPILATEEAAPAPPVAVHEHTAIPSNAIEVSNTAPGHTEVGTGDLGAEAGIEVTRPTESGASEVPQTNVEAAPVEVGSLGQNEDKMDVDEPAVEQGEAPVEDAGLVMGELQPPAGQEALGITGEEDAQPKEAEAETQAKVESAAPAAAVAPADAAPEAVPEVPKE